MNTYIRYRTLFRAVLGQALVLWTVPGCVFMHDYRPAPVQTIDAETKQPIPGASVHISYPPKSSLAPHDSLGVTGSDGIARLDAAPYGNSGALVEVSAKGYLNEQKYLAVKTVEAIEAAHFLEDTGKRPPAIVVEMLAGPKPTVELLVPDGYHGLVRATVDIRKDLPASAGQRCFTYPVSATGNVTVVGPSLLHRVGLLDFHAKNSQGLLPDRPEDPQTVGFWFVKTEKNMNTYLVGTRREYEVERMSNHIDLRGLQLPTSKQSRRGQPSADPTGL